MKKLKLLRTLACVVLVALVTISAVACTSKQQEDTIGNPDVDGTVADTTGTTEPTVMTEPAVTTEPTVTTEPVEITDPAEPTEVWMDYAAWEGSPPPLTGDPAKRLFSVSMGGGFGRFEETALDTWTVYADGSVDSYKLKQRTPAVKLSDEDFEKLRSMVTQEKIEGLTTDENLSACDGGSSYIYFYDENGEILFKKGGYSVLNRSYCELFVEVYRTLLPYFRD